MSVLRIRIRDPVLFYPLDPDSGIRIRDEQILGSGSGIRDKNIPDPQHWSMLKI
jgi:hypothetical protein